MALVSIPVPPDPKRDARALELLADVESWPRFVLKQPHGDFPAGTVFRRAPSSTGNSTRYLVNAVVCECPDYVQNEKVCKHVRAVILWEARQERPAAMPAPLKRYEDLYPACAGGCGDVVEKKGQRCYACSSDQARRLDDVAKRQAVAVTA